MSLSDAQTSLDDIHRLQDRTREEYVRYNYSRCHVLVGAAALFVGYASFDLPDPWNMAGALLVVVLGIGLLVLYRRGARVRRKPSLAEVIFYATVAAAYVGSFLLTLSVAKALDLPLPHTTAAAAMALASIGISILTRPVFKAVVWRERAAR